MHITPGNRSEQAFTLRYKYIDEEPYVVAFEMPGRALSPYVLPVVNTATFQGTTLPDAENWPAPATSKSIWKEPDDPVLLWQEGMESFTNYSIHIFDHHQQQFVTIPENVVAAKWGKAPGEDLLYNDLAPYIHGNKKTIVHAGRESISYQGKKNVSDCFVMADYPGFEGRVCVAKIQLITRTFPSPEYRASEMRGAN